MHYCLSPSHHSHSSLAGLTRAVVDVLLVLVELESECCKVFASGVGGEGERPLVSCGRGSDERSESRLGRLGERVVWSNSSWLFSSCSLTSPSA